MLRDATPRAAARPVIAVSAQSAELLAPHLHLAVRGSVPRPLLRQVLAATYHQVWWPGADTVRFTDDQLPVWDEGSGNYVDPATGEVPGRHQLVAGSPADRGHHGGIRGRR